jgi:hypothetical protein
MARVLSPEAIKKKSGGKPLESIKR